MSASGPTATPGHRALSPDQVARVAKIRAVRRAFIVALHEVGETEPRNGRMGSADLTLAMRHIEDAEYRAIRHITGGPSD